MTYNNKIQIRIIQGSSSIIDCLKKMDFLKVKLLFVFEKDRYIGLVSIGDLQRALINNVSLNTPIKEVLRKDITIAYDYENFEDIKRRMLQLRTECMPILNEVQELTNVYFWEDIFQDDFKKSNKLLNVPVVIMAGGQGSRLKPITNIIPKPLIPIGDKPIIEIIIDKFSTLGVSNFYLSVNYKQEMIRFYFEGVENKNYNLNYFVEPYPLGTGGSLHLLKDKISSTFFVSNCDIIIDQDYYDIYDYHTSNKNELTIVAALRLMQIPYGTLESGENGELLALKEKPELTFMINTGMYILEPHLLNEIPENTFFHITDLIEKVKERRGRVGVFPVSEGAWMDIGEWKEYNKTMKRMGFEEIKMD